MNDVLSEEAQRLRKAVIFLDLVEKNNQEGIVELLATLNDKEKKSIRELSSIFRIG